MIFPFKRVLIWVLHLWVLLDFYIHYICIFPVSIFGCRMLKGSLSLNHSWPKRFGTKAAQQVFIVTPWTGAHQASVHKILQTKILEWVAMSSLMCTFQGPVTIQWSLEVDKEWFQQMWWQAHHPQQEPPFKELSSQEERAGTHRQELGPHNSA